MAARLVPTLIDEMRVERPDLRNLEFLVPPDMAVRARLDEVLAPFRLVGIDENDAVVALLHDAAALGQARRIVAVVAHGGHVGDVDHRNLPALLLQDVDPPVAVLRHRFRVAGQSLPTYSSMVASVHRLQLVHSATSMTMFHVFMTSL